MERNKKTIQAIFEAKSQRRKDLAQLPIEEKVKILVQLQKMALPILQSRGLKIKPWKI